jgi:hypothetical protein
VAQTKEFQYTKEGRGKDQMLKANYRPRTSPDLVFRFLTVIP